MEKQYQPGQIYLYQNHNSVWKYKVIFEVTKVDKRIQFKILWDEGYHYNHDAFSIDSQWDRECRELTEEEKARLL